MPIINSAKLNFYFLKVIKYILFVALGNQAGRSQGSEPVIETMRWPYSDEELLRCIDNEEIPATLVDLLEANHSELFYQGCVIAEIRDYRLTFPLFSFETHHVLLKPTTQVPYPETFL